MTNTIDLQECDKLANNVLPGIARNMHALAAGEPDAGDPSRSEADRIRDAAKAIRSLVALVRDWERRWHEAVGSPEAMEFVAEGGSVASALAVLGRQAAKRELSELDCPACGGSGHIDDKAEVDKCWMPRAQTAESALAAYETADDLAGKIMSFIHDALAAADIPGEGFTLPSFMRVQNLARQRDELAAALQASEEARREAERQWEISAAASTRASMGWLHATERADSAEASLTILRRGMQCFRAKLHAANRPQMTQGLRIELRDACDRLLAQEAALYAASPAPSRTAELAAAARELQEQLNWATDQLDIETALCTTDVSDARDQLEQALARFPEDKSDE